MTERNTRTVEEDICAERHMRIDLQMGFLRSQLSKIEEHMTRLDRKLWGGLTLLCLQLAGVMTAMLKGCQ